MQAVILAGGLATRMRPHTLRVPKSMLEVAGRPFVDWQLERLANAGYADVVMCIGHMGEQIRDHVGDGARYGLRVAWSEEGPVLLGTGGALRLALPLLDEAFLVTYGDSYLPFDYAAPLRMLAAHDDCDGVMAVFRNEGRWDASNVVYGADEGDAGAPSEAANREAGGWVLRYEKGIANGDAAPSFDHIDYGATALRRPVIAALPQGVASGLDAVQRGLAARKRLRACVARERFYEIGSPAGLVELDHLLRARGSS